VGLKGNPVLKKEVACWREKKYLADRAMMIARDITQGRPFGMYTKPLLKRNGDLTEAGRRKKLYASGRSPFDK